MRVKPLRSVTTGYTGPMRGVHLTITPIPDLAKHISMLNTIIEAKEAPSPYKVTQYLRGELFATVNSLLMSDFRFAPEEIEMLNKFFIQLVGLIGMICARSKDYLTEYFESNANNKLAYLTNYKIAMVCSLSELLILVNSLISQGSEAPKLLKVQIYIKSRRRTNRKFYRPISSPMSNSTCQSLVNCTLVMMVTGVGCRLSSGLQSVKYL